MEHKSSEVLSEAADSLLDKPIKLTVDIRPSGKIHAQLISWKICPAKKEFLIQPICLGSLIRISKLILSIDTKQIDFDNMLDSNYRFAASYAGIAAEVVAIAITGGRDEPPRRLVEFILTHFTPRELLATIAVILQQMGVQNFMHSIISLRGLSVLENARQQEVSPKVQGSQIAPGNSLEE